MIGHESYKNLYFMSIYKLLEFKYADSVLCRMTVIRDASEPIIFIFIVFLMKIWSTCNIPASIS